MAGCLLKDEDGNLAKVAIEDYIFNGSDGENDLHKTIRKGRTVRAAGLLHVNEYGDTVIRARNCEEVVWVPPRTYWNPNTGDDLLPGAIAALAISMTGLFLLRKRNGNKYTPQFQKLRRASLMEGRFKQRPQRGSLLPVFRQLAGHFRVQLQRTAAAVCHGAVQMKASVVGVVRHHLIPEGSP